MPDPTASASSWRSPLAGSGARLLLLGLLFLLLQIPQQMIEGVVNERAGRRDEAVKDVHAAWGATQDVVGPFLRIPCVHRWTEEDRNGWKQERVDTTLAWFLPERLHALAVLETDTRRRGLFAVPVYSAALTLEGSFARPQADQCPAAGSTLDWTRAELVLALSDPRSLQAETALRWNGARLDLRPSTGSSVEGLRSGVHVPLGGAVEAFPTESASFTTTLGFNGSGALQLAPVAKEVTVDLRGTWPHPSFQGAWLPRTRSIGPQGFSAEYSMSWLGRDYPQVWHGAEAQAEAIGRSLFGVALASPLDHYVAAQRICKYAALVVLLTLLTVWLTETLSGRRVHFVQYGLIGAALCLFGLLQLALAEHAGFNVAFGLAAAAVVVQVTLYCRSVLGRTRRALAAGAVLAGLYGLLYAILRAEDYALLGGAAALFVLLAATMYLTRRVDWSAVRTAAPPSPA